MFSNLKAMTDDDIINIINRIVTDNMDVSIQDLKLILAEASGRKLEKKYINIIAERIKAKIQPAPVEPKRNTERVPVIKAPAPQPKAEQPKPAKPTFDDVYNPDPIDDEDYLENYEKYPALALLTIILKIFAWICLVGNIIGSVVVGMVFLKGIVYLVCASVFVGIVLGLIFLLVLYSAAESIKLKIDMEEHMRDLKFLLKK